jgi:hypothetical protein
MEARGVEKHEGDVSFQFLPPKCVHFLYITTCSRTCSLLCLTQIASIKNLDQRYSSLICILRHCTPCLFDHPHTTSSGLWLVSTNGKLSSSIGVNSISSSSICEDRLGFCPGPCFRCSNRLALTFFCLFALQSATEPIRKQ